MALSLPFWTEGGTLDCDCACSFRQTSFSLAVSVGFFPVSGRLSRCNKFLRSRSRLTWALTVSATTLHVPHKGGIGTDSRGFCVYGKNFQRTFLSGCENVYLIRVITSCLQIYCKLKENLMRNFILLVQTNRILHSIFLHLLYFSQLVVTCGFLFSFTVLFSFSKHYELVIYQGFNVRLQTACPNCGKFLVSVYLFIINLGEAP